MAKKRKNLILFVALCVILAGFILLYLFLPQKKEEGNDTKETESITVDKIDSTTISSLAVVKEGKEIYSVEKKGETWRFPDQTAVPLDSDTITGLFSCLDPVQASRKITLTEDQKLSQYGLDDPVMTIKVGTSDGKSYQYKLGTTVPITGGYYGLTSAGDNVYCLAEELYSTFDIEKNSLIQMEKLPEIDASCMTLLKVENTKGDDFQAVAEADGKTWKVVKPEQKTLAEDDSQWNTVKGYFTSLSYDSIIEYQSDDLGKYGLQKPSARITVDYYEKKEGSEDTGEAASGSGAKEEKREYKTLQINVGNSCGDGYYVCEKGSSNVYVMAEDAVKNMTDVDEFNLGK